MVKDSHVYTDRGNQRPVQLHAGGNTYHREGIGGTCGLWKTKKQKERKRVQIAWQNRAPVTCGAMVNRAVQVTCYISVTQYLTNEIWWRKAYSSRVQSTMSEMSQRQDFREMGHTSLASPRSRRQILAHTFFVLFTLGSPPVEWSVDLLISINLNKMTFHRHA